MPSRRRATLQLSRLERLMDVIFALILWRIFMLLPRPDGESAAWSSVLDLVAQNWDKLVLAVLGTVIVIVFWLQNNSLLGKLERTDRIHTAYSIFQILFLLVMLYSIGLSVNYGSDVTTRLMESGAAVLVGLTAYLGWRHAMSKGKLLADDVSSDEARATLEENMAEPITAAITIPFAVVGPLVWELSWFVYPAIKVWFSRRRTQQQ